MIRKHLTFRGQLAVLRARHREAEQHYLHAGVALLSDGSHAVRSADHTLAKKHGQCLLMVVDQLKHLPAKGRR